MPPPPGQPILPGGSLPAPPPMPGMPAPGGQFNPGMQTPVSHPAPTGGEPAGKRQKTTDEMLTEADFVSEHGDGGVFTVQCPTDANDKWQLTGQKISVSAKFMMTVKEFKSEIAQQTGLPISSQKLKDSKMGHFLKDAWTLARHNVLVSTVLELGVQKRGGR